MRTFERPLRKTRVEFFRSALRSRGKAASSGREALGAFFRRRDSPTHEWRARVRSKALLRKRLSRECVYARSRKIVPQGNKGLALPISLLLSTYLILDATASYAGLFDLAEDSSGSILR